MIFTIEYTSRILGRKGSYRLNKNGDWEKYIDFHKYSEADKLFNTYNDAKTWLDENSIVKINGKEVCTKKPTKHKVGDTNGDTFKIIVHRLTKPKPLFTKEDIKNILLNGNDNVSNSLIIDWNGIPKLIDIRNTDSTNIRNYAVRYETFGAGGHYVGHRSSLCHLDDIYVSLLEAWLLHLQCGESIYKDYKVCKNTEMELISEINELIGGLQR